MKKILTIALIAALCLGFIGFSQITKAETSTTEDTTQVSPGDLGVNDQNILPDSPFYFLKNWGRGIQLFFAFSQVKKTELENKFTNEKIIELQKMSDNGSSSEKIKKAAENYQKSVERLKNAADKIKDKADSNQEVNKFLEKFANHQVLQEKILQKLEGQVPEAVFEKIKEAREQHLERFKDVMIKLQENKDKMVEKIKNSLENGGVNNSDILDRIKEKMPNNIKAKVEGIREAVRAKVNTKLIEKATEKNLEKECPVAAKPPADFCKRGIIKIQRNQKGCAIGFSCLTPSEQKICTLDSDCPTINCIKAPCPQNKCVEGKCKLVVAEQTECKNLWWFDKENKTCKQKEFCGVYLSLRTFDSETKCKEALTAATATPN